MMLLFLQCFWSTFYPNRFYSMLKAIERKHQNKLKKTVLRTYMRRKKKVEARKKGFLITWPWNGKRQKDKKNTILLEKKK